MIAKPRFSSVPANIDKYDGMIAVEMDIEMLETVKQTLRKVIRKMAETYRYEELQQTVNSYLQLEHLSITYDTVMEGENDDNVSEDQRQ